jgi:hypothetical protein
VANLPAGGLAKSARWSGASGGTPAIVDRRGYAFIRNTVQLQNHTPARIGGSTFSATCTMNGPGFDTQNDCAQGAQGFSVGGTY